MSSASLEPPRHILDEIDFLVEETRGLSKTEFLDDPVRRRAFVRSLETALPLTPTRAADGPCIHGMRIRVIDVLELLAAGQTRDEILADFPYLEREDIAASLVYAARRLGHPVLAA